MYNYTGKNDQGKGKGKGHGNNKGGKGQGYDKGKGKGDKGKKDGGKKGGEDICKDDFLKVRYYWEKGNNQALGNIVLNPNSIQIPSKFSTKLVLVLDVSNSMEDNPLEEMGKKLEKTLDFSEQKP